MTTILRMEPLRPVAEDGEELLEAAASLTVPATAGRGERVLRLWWRLPAAWGHAVQPWADPFVVGLAFPMMQAGAPVRVEGRVSPSLLENLETFMAIWSSWVPDAYRAVAVRADEEAEAPCPAAADGRPAPFLMPFSGGADSCFTLWQHRHGRAGRRNRTIAAAVLMNSFDVRPHLPKAAAIFAGLRRAVEAQLASVGIPLAVINSNFHALNTPWGHSYGTHLVSGLRLFSGRFAGALVPNNMAYAQPMFPWGSNPLSDQYLSGRHFAVVDSGGEFTREAKLAGIADWPEGLAHLRVCFSNPDSHQNCGTCEKCLRTLLSLRLAGIPRPASFAREPADREIARMRFRMPMNWHFWDDLHQVAVKQGRGRESWVRALGAAVRRGRRRYFWQDLRRPFVPLRNGVRKMFRGSAESKSQRAARLGA
jgi:hypothetical protein